MIDMLQNAKDLIAKGKDLGDPELIQMGMELLEQYSPTYADKEEVWEMPDDNMGDGHVPPPIVADPFYVCSNCDHNMPVDKEGRKRCPECKKHKLQMVTPTTKVIDDEPQRPTYDELLEALENQAMSPQPNNDMDQFHMQVRSKGDKRIHYDENGKADGIIRKRESVDPEGIHNIWQDEGEDRDDAGNALLKKFTKVSPRTRQPAKMLDVECDNCHKVEKMHPIHAGGRGRHLCEKCIRRRSQR